MSEPRCIGAIDVMSAFWEVAQSSPDRPAIIENGRELSYAYVLAQVREIASRLGPGCGVVGVTVTRSADTIISLLGVLAAGGCYCPIDPTFPVERQQTIARLSGCKVVLTAGPSSSFPGLQLVDRELQGTAAAAAVDGRAWLTPASPEAPAYVLFTSGSTGEPKPVLTPRRAINAAVQSLRELFEVAPSDRVLQFASLNWDTCFEEIFPTLTSGAALIIDRDAYTGSLPRLLRTIQQQRVSVVDLPTALWHELVYFLAEERKALPESLRLLVIGGEAARSARLADWCALGAGRVRLVNTYGCTETTLVTHAIDLHGPRVGAAGATWSAADEVPLGHALPHVVEGIGDTGELLIGGPAVALGYLGAADATEARFRTLDLGAGSQRYFLTGDRVARSPAGALLHRGRLDGQLKVRGIRVDPGEVEAEISGHEGVAAVAVVGVTVADHTKMVAYVVPRPGGNVETLATDIVAYLRRRVPAHIVPSQLTVVPELVYTPSGKIDRAASHMRHLPPTRARSSAK